MNIVNIFELTRDQVLPYIEILKVALSKLPSDGQRAWRGHKRHLPKEIGAKIALEGFTSATMDRDLALEFCTKMDGGKSSCSDRTLICILSSTSGKSISKFSARPEEMEMIFPPDTIFEVVNPPEDTFGDDQQAAQAATRKLQQDSPEATIEMVYVIQVCGEP